ncbi:MAG: ABC transporter ATP-binding protein [Cytophagales bacterium]|nr:ABC transporter ATP-binding protein [Cytophagales bacterium]
MDVVSINNISKAYSEHQALKNINLSIPSQSIFGLLGPNGAGKTTLIRIINQIIDADEGEVLINNEPLTPSHVRAIGYLPEERGLYKKMKVGDQLIYLGQLRGLSSKEAKRRGMEWCKKLDILEWWGKKVEDLSKGMAQKIQFIATILHEPKLIILDEPFSGFDPVNAEMIKDEILELRDNGSTIIFSTHRMESVEELCDHIALINNATKILDGKKIDIKEAHKDGSFLLEYKGTLNNIQGLEIVGTEQTDFGLTRSTLKSDLNPNPNDILKQLINQVEIHSFIERIPSINDIFISKVKGADNE